MEDPKKIITEEEKMAESKRIFQLFHADYVDTKRQARREDRLEYRGEENISIRGRKKFLKTLSKISRAGAIIDDKDIEILTNAMYLHPNFISKELILLLINNANLKYGIDGIEHTLRDIIDILEAVGDTQYLKSSRDYLQWLRGQKTILKVKELRGQNLSIEEIAERLNLTTAEVAVYLKRPTVDIDFFGEEEKE